MILLLRFMLHLFFLGSYAIALHKEQCGTAWPRGVHWRGDAFGCHSLSQCCSVCLGSELHPLGCSGLFSPGLPALLCRPLRRRDGAMTSPLSLPGPFFSIKFPQWKPTASNLCVPENVGAASVSVSHANGGRPLLPQCAPRHCTIWCLVIITKKNCPIPQEHQLVLGWWLLLSASLQWDGCSKLGLRLTGGAA